MTATWSSTSPRSTRRDDRSRRAAADRLSAGFAQALADLVASPPLCREVRAHPSRLSECYELTDLELRRLVDMANQRGMVCNCTLYRANRLAPLALNLHD